MKKFVVYTLIVIVIGVTFSFIIIKAASVGRQDNYFNRVLRPYLVQYPLARKIFALHFDGEGAHDYLGHADTSIVIEVDHMAGIEIDTTMLDNLARQIQKATGKPTKYILSNSVIPYEKNLSNEKIREVIDKNRNMTAHGKEAVLYLIFLSSLDESPKTVGLTYEEYGIVLFYDSLVSFTEAYPATFDNYLLSTVLHEAGHQFGLDHNEKPGCLMNSHLEADHKPRPNPDEVVTDFCDDEIAALRQGLSPQY